MNQNVGGHRGRDSGAGGKSAVQFFQNEAGPALKLKAGKVLLEHFDRKARTVAGNTESES